MPGWTNFWANAELVKTIVIAHAKKRILKEFLIILNLWTVTLQNPPPQRGLSILVLRIFKLLQDLLSYIGYLFMLIIALLLVLSIELINIYALHFPSAVSTHTPASPFRLIAKLGAVVKSSF